jgi:hypothetical protein
MIKKNANGCHSWLKFESLKNFETSGTFTESLELSHAFAACRVEINCLYGAGTLEVDHLWGIGCNR